MPRLNKTYDEPATKLVDEDCKEDAEGEIKATEEPSCLGRCSWLANSLVANNSPRGCALRRGLRQLLYRISHEMPLQSRPRQGKG
jgi:hypothetical protein